MQGLGMVVNYLKRTNSSHNASHFVKNIENIFNLSFQFVVLKKSYFCILIIL